MDRGKKAAYNSIASILSEGITIVCGFVLPRLILTNYGSAYNGLTQSVSQFLSVVALLRAGVGGATRAALYKSLAKKDTAQISATIRATELFMRKVALIFAVFVIFFSCMYPLIVQNEFEWLFSASLVLIISISTFVQYYFGITYQILLQADQRQYISSIMNMCTTVLYTLITVLLINAGVGIHGVKLGSALIHCIPPVIYNQYARRYYHIDHNAKPDYSSINQRWDAMFHQLAGFIYSNTDIMLIAIFSNIREVSVYTTYTLVSTGLKQLMATITRGVEAAFGDMLARNERRVLLDNVIIYETLLHSVVCVLFGAACVLITPFIRVYTHGIQDANYIRYAFGYLLIITEAIHLLREPYHSITEAAGHYKSTKHIAMIQAGLNLAISIVLIQFWGLMGVIIGTLVSDIYCGIAYRLYVKRRIIPELSLVHYIKRYAITVLSFVLIWGYSKFLPSMTESSTYLQWFALASEVTFGAILITFALSIVFYKNETIRLYSKICDIIKRVFHKSRRRIL